MKRKTVPNDLRFALMYRRRLPGESFRTNVIPRLAVFPRSAPCRGLHWPGTWAAPVRRSSEEVMSGFLTPEELRKLKPAETSTFPSPIPTQIVSSDEYFPEHQTRQQREVEARVKSLGNELARKQGLSRRAFFTTAAGMASAFLAMNQVYGRLFDVTPAEAATPELAQERANALQDQFIFDCHTHFLRDDTRLNNFIAGRKSVEMPAGIPSFAAKSRRWKI